MFSAIRRGASPPFRGRCSAGAARAAGRAPRPAARASRAARRARGGSAGRGVRARAACLGRALPHLGRQEPARARGPRAPRARMRSASARAAASSSAALRSAASTTRGRARRSKAPRPRLELLHGVRHRAQVLGHGLGVEAVGGPREVLALDRLAARVHSRLSVAVSRRGSGRRALLLDAEGAAHERMDPAEVRVRAGLEVLRRREAVRAAVVIGRSVPSVPDSN